MSVLLFVKTEPRGGVDARDARRRAGGLAQDQPLEHARAGAAHELVCAFVRRSRVFAF